MDTGDGGKKTAKNLKFKVESGPGPSSKRWMRSDSKKSLDNIGASEISKVNSDVDDKKSEIDHGKVKKRKLFSSEKPSKRLHADHTEHSDEVVAKESKELSNLPGELLVKILEMVPISQWSSLESVSRIFQDTVYALWGQQREIQLNKLVYNKEKKPHQLLDATLRKFLIRAPNVASISGFAEFCDGRRTIRLPTIQLLSKFEHLQTIDFSDGAVTAGSFAVFLESSASRQSWKSLQLDIGGGIHGKMKSQNAVARKNQPALNLECLKFNMEMLQMFDHILPPIEWSGLKKLIIVSPVTSKDVLPIIRQCTQVSHLEIVVPECGNGNGQPSYGEFLQSVADLVNLSILKINCDCSVENSLRDALLVLIQDLRRRRITNLALMDSYCSHQIVDAIIDNLPRLRSLELDVTNCTKSSLERLANKMGQLETLDLYQHRCSSIIDGAVVRAIGGNMSNLQCLTLYYPVANSEDYASFGNLRNLKKLRVLGSYMDCGIIENWAHLGFGSCLETLELIIPWYISPELMGRFFKNMPRLRSVKLLAVTDGILEAIGESCPELVELDLGNSSTITSSAIQSVIDRCRQLKFLGVVGRSEWFPATLTVGKYRKITFKAYR